MAFIHVYSTVRLAFGYAMLAPIEDQFDVFLGS